MRFTGEEERQLKLTGEGEKQLRLTGEGEKQLKLTGEGERQLRLTGEEEKQLKLTGEEVERLSLIGTKRKAALRCVYWKPAVTSYFFGSVFWNRRCFDWSGRKQTIFTLGVTENTFITIVNIL